MKNGDVFFTHSNALLGRLIRFITGAKVSHVGILVELEGILFAVEMTAHGCEMRPKDVRFKDPKIIPFVATPKHLPSDFKKLVIKDVGRIKYDFWGLFMAPFYRTKGQEKICSEWISNILGLKFPGLTREITPVDIFNVLFNE